MKLSTFSILLFLCVLPVRAEEPTEIVMGFSPSENSSAMENKGKALSAYFQKNIGLKVKVFVANDYTALIEAMRSKRVDFAWLPPYSYIAAEKMADAKVLLKVGRKGLANVYSAIISRADKNILSWEDLKGKNIAWVDQASFTGHILPKAMLLQKTKMDVDKFLGRQIFAGSHDTVVLAVANGTVDAGATWSNDNKGKDGAWHRYLKEKANKIRVVYMSPPSPTDTLSTTSAFEQMHPSLVKKITDTFLAMPNNAEGKKVLLDLYGIDNLLRTNSKEFETVRKAAAAIGLK